MMPGFLTLISFFLMSSIFYRNIDQVNIEKKPKGFFSKDKKISSSEQANDNNKFLFVDCTGFFE